MPTRREATMIFFITSWFLLTEDHYDVSTTNIYIHSNRALLLGVFFFVLFCFVFVGFVVFFGGGFLFLIFY